ncbi:hypothetical protein CHS0354_026102 [Potamilus streckersoni]|uniref:Amino acid transporter n=1 Tax=Potamilus streckersoni TaxID=2493646 RepID=A0AAE0VMW7_9BIVA|nr:hypothetical protein CHS0354_026102 [Potamilus streckersoni]
MEVTTQERDDKRKIEIEENVSSFLQLKRRIGLVGAASFVVGVVIGSGIFVSPKNVLVYSGSIGLCLMIWVGVGLFMLIISLVYAELGTAFHHSGGDYIYIKDAFGGLPAFLVVWAQAMLRTPATRTLKALVFADYVDKVVSSTSCSIPRSIKLMIAVIEILTLAITNMISVRLTTNIQVFFTATKVIALVIIGFGGIVKLAQGSFGELTMGFEGTNEDFTVVLAIYSCFFAYDGWKAINNIAEEIYQPKRNIPLALVLSTLVIMTVYVLANVSYFSVLTKQEFLASWTVAYSWGQKILGSAAIIVPISVLCSIHGSSNGSNFGVSRIMFAASREGQLPELMSYLHVNSLIPTFSIAFSTFISLLMLLPADIEQLINLVGFVTFILVCGTMAANIKFRLTMKEYSPVFKSLLLSMLGWFKCSRILD